eukprot:CAMPEP_0201540036 /NCGR_PEP_ID=MMETSP0161_2-20130828/70731_1 /ASSEMBLY_ACC=CAM_ASM_000251 /TAXON_ID=180227 /ORGANISM="Neoparamoeba aestuarina, Strain SoJaBio B1-5/56/2" /LENGTH=329 /DNA_ID=CAMNT_0047947481 /DNA_START=754 /DNA_END=1743 /DNA_ORIENTATION=-
MGVHFPFENLLLKKGPQKSEIEKIERSQGEKERNGMDEWEKRVEWENFLFSEHFEGMGEKERERRKGARGRGWRKERGQGREEEVIRLGGETPVTEKEKGRHYQQHPKQQPKENLPPWSEMVLSATMRVPIPNIGFLSWLNHTFHGRGEVHRISPSWDASISHGTKFTHQQKFVLLYRAFNSYLRTKSQISTALFRAGLFKKTKTRKGGGGGEEMPQMIQGVVADSLEDLRREDVFVPREHAILMHRRAYKFTGDGRIGNCYADFTFPNQFGGELLKRMNKICDYKFFMGKEDPIRPAFQLRAAFPQSEEEVQQQLLRMQQRKEMRQQH